MGAIIEFKRPEAAKPHEDEPKKITGCWLYTEKFDEISRYLLNPEIPYETRVQWLNNWRTDWNLEPIDMPEVRREN